jgi:hypothetical protein
MMSLQTRVLYYTTDKGEHIVRNEIELLNKNEIPKVLKLVSRLEMYGQNIGGDHVKHIRGKIWELRQDRYRILYFTYIRNTENTGTGDWNSRGKDG